MKAILIGGLLLMVLMLAGISLANENEGAESYYQNHCSESNAVACILHGNAIPNN